MILVQIELFLAIFVESYANAVGGVSRGPVRSLDERTTGGE